METCEEWARICGGDDILRLDKKHAAYACAWETCLMEEIIFALADGFGGLAEQTGGEVRVRMKLCQLHSGKVCMERIGQELRVKIMELCRSLE